MVKHRNKYYIYLYIYIEHNILEVEMKIIRKTLFVQTSGTLSHRIEQYSHHVCILVVTRPACWISLLSFRQSLLRFVLGFLAIIK